MFIEPQACSQLPGQVSSASGHLLPEAEPFGWPGIVVLGTASCRLTTVLSHIAEGDMLRTTSIPLMPSWIINNLSPLLESFLWEGSRVSADETQAPSPDFGDKLALRKESKSQR